MAKDVNKFLDKPLFIAGLLTFIVAIITTQSILQKPKMLEPGVQLSRYNNYLIFKQSFFHLSQNKDLYALYPDEHLDYYKYSPSFSLLMAPLAILPDAPGLFIWNLLNILLLFFALWNLPALPAKSRLLMLAFVIIELVGTTQNSQSNALIAALILFAFVFLEKKRPALAALCIVLTIFIKLFGIVALALLIFYPNKPRMIMYTLAWGILIALLPLLVISSSQLAFLYQSWFGLLRNDHSASFGLSVAGLIYSWFGVEYKNLAVIVGIILFCIPLVRVRFFDHLKFRLFFLSSILIWIVIFNHKAESATFIIAVSGIAIWFFCQEIKTENMILLILAFIFTILSPTDIFPRAIRKNYVIPYVLKALPCILIWLKIIADMVFYRKGEVERFRVQG